jgi:hypothetical protein
VFCLFWCGVVWFVLTTELCAAAVKIIFFTG